MHFPKQIDPYMNPQNNMHKLVGVHDTVGSVRPRSDSKAVQHSLSYILVSNWCTGIDC
jgi:hypothetical protein